MTNHFEQNKYKFIFIYFSSIPYRDVIMAGVEFVKSFVHENLLNDKFMQKMYVLHFILQELAWILQTIVKTLSLCGKMSCLSASYAIVTTHFKFLNISISLYIKLIIDLSNDYFID